MTQCWRLDDGQQTLVLAACAGRLPVCVYWGRPLPMAEDLTAVTRAHAIDLTGGMLDENPEISLSPEVSRSFPGQPGLVLRDISGAPITPQLMFEGQETGAQSLTLRYADAAAGVAVAFSFTSDLQTHVITAQTRFAAARDDVWVEWRAAPVLPAPQRADDMIDFSGRWCGEFQPVRSPWTPGIRLRENRTGRSGHEHFPGLIIPARGTLNTQGEAYAFHYGWSGGHRMIAEELPDGRRQVQFGHAPAGR
ncbi:MAG: glycoside hydrolase family 36 N-terminal domain-containing protein, partial [Pseudorhodobacter sp.]